MSLKSKRNFAFHVNLCCFKDVLICLLEIQDKMLFWNIIFAVFIIFITLVQVGFLFLFFEDMNQCMLTSFFVNPLTYILPLSCIRCSCSLTACF